MLLELTQIHKTFGEVAVLKGVGFQVGEGNVLGLVGENGAGKSTLMNIVGGIFSASSGEMAINGRRYIPGSPNDALKEGIAFIHQELNLFPNLTVAENLFITNFPKKKILGFSFVDKMKARKKTSELLALVGLTISPNKKVEELTAAQRQMVEIAKALSTSPKIIIFDEPTTSLTRHEAQKLFNLINALKSKGMTMILISHNLDDVMLLSDQIAVLRDGEMVHHDKKTYYTIPSLVKYMVGRNMDQYFPKRKVTPLEETCLKVSGLGAGFIRNIDFSIKKQEVVGFYGLVGAGRSEMARIIYGLDPKEVGTIAWNGKKIRTPSPVNWIKKGVAFLTENRQEEGLMAQQTIAKNIQLAALPRHTMFTEIIDHKSISRKSKVQADATKIKYADFTEQLVATLSGGNQQKVVLAKWLMISPQLFILDEPTKGIDIGAKHEIYKLINQLVESGSSILLISSEIEELLGLCDRILVLSEGKITEEFKKTEFDRSAILEAALHKSRKEEFQP